MTTEPNLYECLGELKQFFILIKERALKILKKEDLISSFTSHNIEHSERIITNLFALIEKRLKLEEHEAFVLVGAAYLHDISIACPEDILPNCQFGRGYYQKEVRKNHGEYSANYIRNILLPELLSDTSIPSMMIRENSDLIEGIARICHFHTAETEILDKCIPPSNRLRRISLLAYLFVIADELDAGEARVRVREVLNSSIDFSAKEFWLLHSTITGKEIKGNKIIIFCSRPKGILEHRFRKIGINPLIKHMRSIIKRANNVIQKFKIKGFSISCTISKTPLLSNTKEINELNEKYTFDQNVDRRIKKWQKLIDSRTIQKGVIEQNLIKNEFHVFRRWGSSTHRLFSNRRGLQKGGGYFLSWNGFGLVIDPGYEFLSNVFSMRHFHFTIRDFHGVFISHAHDDHTHDLEPIISLAYRVRRNNEISNKENECDFPIVCSEGVRWKYSPITAANQFVKLLPLIPTKNSRRVPDILPKENSPIPLLSQYGLRIESILSFHNERPWHLNNTGMVTKIYCGEEKQFCIGYTSDTGYDIELVDFLKDANLVLIHLGNKLNNNNDPYHPHLGERGCIDLISNLKFYKPQLFMLGEFGAEEFISGNRDDRIQFTTRIESLSGVLNLNKRVLPADIGLRVKLPSLEVWCEKPPRRYQPTSDNPNGFWNHPLNVNLTCLPGHEIHYIA